MHWNIKEKLLFLFFWNHKQLSCGKESYQPTPPPKKKNAFIFFSTTYAFTSLIFFFKTLQEINLTPAVTLEAPTRTKLVISLTSLFC